MAMNEKFYAEAGFGNFGIAFLPADTNVNKNLFTNSAVEGVIVKAINISSNDSAAEYFELSMYDGANTFILGTIPIPISAGQSATGAVPSVNLLDGANIKGLERDINGNYIIKLAGGWSLRGRMIGTITSGKQITVTGFYASMTAV